MAILFKKEKGKNIYKGIVGKEQIQKADKLYEYLAAKIPRLETELSEQYEKISIQFWYYFGKGLREIVEKFDIDNQDRQYLWEAIANLAASDVSVRKNRSSNRTNYEYFYRLSEVSLTDVEKLNWSEWSTFFDSITIRREERSFAWFITKLSDRKMDRKTMRTLMIAMNKALEGKETWMYSDEDLWKRFNAALMASLFLISNAPKDKMIQKKTNKPLSERQQIVNKKALQKKTKIRQKFFKEFFMLVDLKEKLSIEAMCIEAFKKVKG